MLTKILTLLMISVHPAAEIGLPKAGLVIENKNYIVGYSARDKQSLWAAEKLTVVPIKPGRDGTWRSDLRAPDCGDSLDYVGTGYDRGHLAAAANYDENGDTFLFSNCSPQNATLNRGVWATLEERAREKVVPDTVVYVFTGPCWAPDEPEDIGIETEKQIIIKYIGRRHIPVPTHMYKVWYTVHKHSEYGAAGFLIPNRKPGLPTPEQYKCPIDRIEHWTGLDFANELPLTVQRKLEE